MTTPSAHDLLPDELAALVRNLRETGYEILVIGLPGEDGYSLLRKLRARNPNVPAMATSAMPKAGNTDDGRRP